MNSNLQRIEDRMVLDDKRIVIAEAFRLMEEHLGSARSAVQELHTAFYHGLAGKLTPALQAPGKLLVALRVGRKQLPPPLKLIYPDEVGNIGWYYRVSKVALVSASSRINVSITFPLADRFFTV